MSPSCRSAPFGPHTWRERRLEVWEERENSMLASLPWAMLVVVSVATVVIRKWSGESWALDLGLCAVTGAWMLAERLLPPAWRERTWAVDGYFTGLVLLMAVLLYRNVWFGFFTFTGYFPAMRLRPLWARGAGVVVIATLTGISQAGGVPRQGGVMVFVALACVLVNVVIAGGFCWFGWVSETQNERRKALVAELRSANERLEATLEENAGLHQQLLSQAREAGVLDERQRMAREIHDTLAQGLTGIITQLQAAEQASENPAARRRHFDTATRLARDSLTEARRSVDALRPQPLERASLADALSSVADSWAALHDVSASVTVTGEPRPMAPDTEFALLRTAQEALANVAKHAAASRVGLTLSYMDDEIALDVRDDGRGFDPARRPARSGGSSAAYGSGAGGSSVGGSGVGGSGVGGSGGAGSAAGPGGSGSGGSGGFGLVAMRERIEAASGTLQVESAPGAGTAISACVPFRPASASAPAASVPDSTPALAPASASGSASAPSVPAGSAGLSASAAALTRAGR